MSSILCRLCALQCEKLVDIYERENSDMQLSSKIATCLHIWVTKEDILPKTVCLSCCSKLYDFSDFLQKSTKAQMFLRKMYEIQPKNCKNEKIESNVESPNNPQSKPMKCKNKRKLKTEEVQIPEEPLDNQCSQPDSMDESLKTSKNKVIDVSTIDCPDKNDTDEVMKLIGCDRKRSRRPKESPTVSDVPANPRLTYFLKEYSWACTICENRSMNTVQELMDHYKSEHNKPPVFKCMSCEKQYERYRSFNRHVKMHINPERYPCDVCGKSFNSSSTLRSHSYVHTQEKPHVCKTCGKSYKCFGALYDHGKKHLPDEVKEKHRCDLCNKELTTRHSLENHRKIHTGEKNFVCDICGEAFAAKSYLKAHFDKHTDGTNHVCSTCGKSLRSAYLLGRHKTLHTGIKPHQCDVCGKEFRERGALREHSRVHSVDKPFICEFCGKSFRFKGLLTGHLRQHTGERPYSCLECRRFFTNWGNYNKHMKRIHDCDTSSRKNNSQYSNAANDIGDIKTGECAVVTAEDKTNPPPSSRDDTSQKRKSSTEPEFDADHS